MPVKNNLAEDGAVPGLAFELVEGRIRWRKEMTVPELAEVLLPSIHNNDRRRLRRAACEWIKEALADGPVPSGEVVKQALCCGISRGTLNRALTDLGVTSHKTGFNGGWEMRWTRQPEPPRREPVFGPNGGFRIVGAEEEEERKAEGGRQKAEEGVDSGEACRSSRREAGQGDKEASGQGDKETRGQGEAVVAMNASCASSEECGEIDAASCASSKKCGDFSVPSCASSLGSEEEEADAANGVCSEEWRTVDAAGRPHPDPLPVGEGADASCASSEAEPSVADGQCKMQNAKCPGTPGKNDASGNSAESEALSPKAHELQAKTPACNPKSQIQNPKSAGRSATGKSGDESHTLQKESGEEPPGLEAEDVSPHWMEAWCDKIAEAVRKAC